MSSFFDPIEKGIKDSEEYLKKKVDEEDVMATCLTPGVTVVEYADPQAFITQLYEMIDPEYQILGKGIMAEMLKKQQGRPIIRWDIKTFRKGDAIESMFKLSKSPIQPKPIVIFDNITDIPEGDNNTYDDPTFIENIVLHSWKNDTIHLTHHKYGPFQLNKWDFTVIFPIQKGSLKNLHHRLEDGIAYIVEE
jgi:hypothetical protein